MKRIGTFLFAVALGLAFVDSGWAQQQSQDLLRSSPKILQVFRECVSRAGQSTVRVLCGGKDSALGTVVHADGYILTKASELQGEVKCKLRSGREVEAQIVGVHDAYDLALLKVEDKKLTPVQWVDSKLALVGHWIATPGPGDDPVAIGVVSVATRRFPEGKPLPRPNLSSGYLGVGVELGDLGARINSILAGGGAAKAGLKIDDEIVAASGKEIKTPESLIELLKNTKPGEVINLKVKRGETTVDVMATLGKRPQDRGEVQNNMGSKLSERRTGFPAILQHDAIIKPTDCGGPLVDLDGRVVGINIARAGRTESYAIPAEEITPLLKDLIAGKYPPPNPKAMK